MSDMDRAGSFVSAAALNAQGGIGLSTHDILRLAAIAAAGLALRVDLDNADIRIGSDLIAALDAFDARLGAALAPE